MVTKIQPRSRGSGLAALLVTLALVLAACGQDAGSPATSPGEGDSADGKRVAVLFPGLVDDESWNQAGFEGLQQAEGEGVEIAYTENASQDQQVELFRNYAQQGFNVVIGHGGEYMDAALQVAEEFTDVEFVVTNGNKSAENVTSLALSYGDMGYLAGVLAASMTETNHIGVAVGETIPIAEDAVRGYEAGAMSINPEIEVTQSVTGDWADVALAREAALAQIADGVDVLWHVLDAADAGVMSAAEDEGVYVIGLYADQSHLAPTAHIGASLSDASLVIYEAATGELDGQAHTEGVAEGVVSFGAYSDVVPEEAQQAVSEAEEALRTGEATY
jgi:basic membrane protein A and related proteins